MALIDSLVIHHDTVEVVKNPSRRSKGSRSDAHVPKTNVVVAEDSAGHPVVTTTIEEHDVGGRYPHSTHPPTTIAQDHDSSGSKYSPPTKLVATDVGNIPASVSPPPATVVVTPAPPTIVAPAPPVGVGYDPAVRPHAPMPDARPATIVASDPASGGLAVKPVPSLAPPLTSACK